MLNCGRLIDQPRLIYILIATMCMVATVTHAQTNTAAMINRAFSSSNETYIITSFNYSADAVTTVTTTTVTPSTAIYIIVSYITSTTTTTTTTATTTAAYCVNGSYILLSNGTCVSRNDEQVRYTNVLRSNSTNGTELALAITGYIDTITNSTVTSYSNNTVTLGEIDRVLDNITNSNNSIATNTSVLVTTQVGESVSNATIIGLSYNQEIGGTTINTTNRLNVINSRQQVTGVVTLETLMGSRFFNMLLILDPTPFQSTISPNNDTSTTIASSIVIASVDRNISSNIKIELYFKATQLSQSRTDGVYECAFYDIAALEWRNTGCSRTRYDPQFDRYECRCSHLTSFALIWLPLPLNEPPKYDAQDIVSIIAQSISIACFVAILIHAIQARVQSPVEFSDPRNLLPLIACAVTMLLFIFYIALGATVYYRSKQMSTWTNEDTQSATSRVMPEDFNRTSSSSESLLAMPPNTYGSCSAAEQGLMYIVYFLIILMFCVKTSIDYYNYLHYVALFPPPPAQRLVITMGISFIISIILMSFAIGFNHSSGQSIVQVVRGKLCWFKPHVIHYFMTIPIVIFIAVNIFITILVVKYAWSDANETEKRKVRYKRRQRCIVVLLASCFTQGVAWIFGVLIPVGDARAAAALGWIFVIFNGLEGLWALLLYFVCYNERPYQSMPTLGAGGNDDGFVPVIPNDVDFDFQPNLPEPRHREDRYNLPENMAQENQETPGRRLDDNRPAAEELELRQRRGDRHDEVLFDTNSIPM